MIETAGVEQERNGQGNDMEHIEVLADEVLDRIIFLDESLGALFKQECDAPMSGAAKRGLLCALLDLRVEANRLNKAIKEAKKVK